MNVKPFCLFGMLLFLLLFSSCEEVIELNLNDAAKKYVIEATLTNQANGAKVLISQTKSYADENEFIGVSGAIVEITDETGNTTRLTETAKKGIYTNATLKGSPTKNYKLKVLVGGETYTANSTMPAIVKLDDIYAYELNLFDGPRLYTHIRYTDPKDVKNFYRFLEYKNNVYTKSIMVANDEFTDGKQINRTIFPYKFDEESRLRKGDKIKLEFLNIDEPIYNYWFSVKDGAQRASDSAAPANPASNIKGGAIGYFSAHTYQTLSYTVD